MSKEQRKTEEGSKFEVSIMSAKVKKVPYAVAQTESENQFKKRREIFG